MGAWPQLIERTSIWARTSRSAAPRTRPAPALRHRPGDLGARPRLQGARARQSLRDRCQLLSLDRRGEPDADDHRQRAARRRPDQGAAARECGRAAASWPGQPHRGRPRPGRSASTATRSAFTVRPRPAMAAPAALGLRPARGGRHAPGRRTSPSCASTAGSPYPPDSRSNDLWFQHLAIVVDDMDAAYAQLSAQSAWRRSARTGRSCCRRQRQRARLQVPRPGRPSARADLVPAGPGPPGAGNAGRRGRSSASTTPPWRSPRPAAASPSTARSASRSAPGRSTRGRPQSRLDGLAGAGVRVTGLRPGAPGARASNCSPTCRPGRGPRPPSTDVVTDWVTLAVAFTGRAVRRAGPRRPPPGSGRSGIRRASLAASHVRRGQRVQRHLAERAASGAPA